MKTLLGVLVLFGLALAVTVDAPQSKQWSKDFYYSGDVDCQGNASCALGVTNAVSCTFTVTSSVYGANPYIAVYSGSRPFRVMIDVPENGRYSIKDDCSSGTETFTVTHYFEVHELENWQKFLYLALLVLPFAMIAYALYRLAIGKEFILYPGAASLAVVVKYVFNLMTNYSFLSELWILDLGVMVLAVILIVIGMMREGARIAGESDGRGRF